MTRSRCSAAAACCSSTTNRPRLLSNPANDFVSGFIGADRGYRGLQFRHATGLPLHDIRTVAEADIDALNLGPGRVGAGHQARRHRRTRGSTPTASNCTESGKSLYDSTIAGGSLFQPDGTLRLALDAALSSPAGLGVAVDERRAGDRRGEGRRRARGAGGSATAGARLAVNYLLTHLDNAWALTLIHLRLSLVPMVLGLVIAVPLGAFVQRTTAAAAADDRDREHHLHHPVAGAVRGAAADHPDPHPRRGQRHRRADALHRRAAGAGGARGARRGVARRARRRHRRRLQAARPGC